MLACLLSLVILYNLLQIYCRLCTAKSKIMRMCKESRVIAF
uniref:Uncharacterized protein n=1 Tax=Rhizophora mucronata TaxID=61149 RepID=A0A2P2PML0_RHIMU